MKQEHDEGGAAEFWDGLYNEREQVWTGRPNEAVVREVSELPPGTALDVGCGEGGDAIWLAQHGWQVTGTDVSPVALARAAAAAAELGVGDRVIWRWHDLTSSFPIGSYDLVSAAFLHSPVDMPREEILRAAARAVAPGGTLLIVGHASFPPWSRHDHTEADFPTPQAVLDSCQLMTEEWLTRTLAAEGREATGPEGQTAILTDYIVRVERRPARGVNSK